MYIQSRFEETRLETLHALIGAHPLGALAVVGKTGIDINHMPFLIHAEAETPGILRGHIPRANPIWQDFCSSEYEAAVIFQGPESYITPSWYPSKHQHGKAVPTWNYAVVHAYGRPVFIEDTAWLLQHVTALTNSQESSQVLPWAVSDAPADYIAQMLGSIVGIEIRLSRLQGKWKVSQNRSASDRLGVIAGLNSRHHEKADAMENLVREYLAGDTAS